MVSQTWTTTRTSRSSACLRAEDANKVLSEVAPVYETLPGWMPPTSDIKQYDQLPANCRRYVERIAELTGARIGIVSVGPERDRPIVCEKMF